ncbi:FkbM family methyltransferase [Saccharothrix algeriensis]|uniref:FkbM family methyltransferase n=2 Tax=Saccharothrix algeriensis TaxID=173560 RepID=A0ABS2SFE8_9PSEU|nr:FkbM family methyltransferase [Saccharothrix algeriensis]MBM7814992.1 FkbM family methyltransferase [Saccharothrix algeriensis]
MPLVPTPRRVLPRLRDRVVSDAVRGLARAGRWVEPELRGLRGLVRRGDVCLDVGAALGLYTAELSRLVGPTGVVHSAEPLPFAHVAPSRLLGLRSLPNVRWHRLALAARSGPLTMSVPLRNGRFVTGRSFLTAGADGLGSNAEFEDQAEVLVEALTLDGFCDRFGVDRVDFVKADVEGAEFDVLLGGSRLLERCAPTLLLEVEERHLGRFHRSPGTVRDWLAERGYRMWAWGGSAWRETREVVGSRRNYLFSRGVPGRRPQGRG